MRYLRSSSTCSMLWLLLAICWGSWSAAIACGQEAQQLLSYNIRYLNPGDGEDVWGNRAETVIDTIRQAEIVGLQEVVAEQFNRISQATEDSFEWYGRGRDDGDQQGEMTPIGWRKDQFTCEDRGTFWLSPQPDVVGGVGWDAALPRIASWAKLKRKVDGRVLLVVNTHFDHRGQKARQQSAKLLRDWIAKHRGDLPAVLMGDLNAALADPPLQQLLDANAQDAPPLTDALAVTRQAATGPDSTWNGFREIAVGRRIDHILITNGVQVEQFATLDPRTPSDRFASDHLPVMAKLAW